MLCTFREDLLSRDTGSPTACNARLQSPRVFVNIVMRSSRVFCRHLAPLDAGQVREDAQEWVCVLDDEQSAETAATRSGSGVLRGASQFAGVKAHDVVRAKEAGEVRRREKRTVAGQR